MSLRTLPRWIPALVAGLVLAAGRVPSAAPQVPAQDLRPIPPPPWDDPSEISVADLANAAMEEDAGTWDGFFVLEDEEWANFEYNLCVMAGMSPCPPDTSDVIPVNGDSSGPTPPQNEDVIPINGDSSTPQDEVMPEPESTTEERGSGPFVDPIEMVADPADGMRTPAARLDKPVMLIAETGAGNFELRAYSPGGLPLVRRQALSKLHGVIAPLSATNRKLAEKFAATTLAPGSGVHVTRIPLRGFCVNPMRVPPTPGTLFVWAQRATQEQYAPSRPVRVMAEFAARRGYFRPQGDPKAYSDFITQYAIWAKLEHWDRARFADEFVKRTRQAAAAAHKPWTSEHDQTLRALAPGRWKDIQLVTRAADAALARARTKSAGASR